MEPKIPLAELSIAESAPITYNSPSLADHLPMQVLFGKRPKIIGSYRLGRTLGRGAYCKVKHATHIVSKEKFAIKILKPTQPKNWIEVEREVEILRQIQHPSIKPDLQPQRGWKQRKLNLWEYVYTHGAIDEEFARKLFRQIVSGLDYCHMHLICHRDLKLENILLDEHDNIKINDFGLSNFIKPGHSMHTFCGTLSYAAPELLMHQSYAGPAVDVWSLGVILYTMLVGDLPWNLDKPEIQQKELQLLAAGKFRIPLVYGISESCIMLLKMMLQPQAKNRVTLEQVRQHPWTIKGYTGPPPRILEIAADLSICPLSYRVVMSANRPFWDLHLTENRYQTLLRKKIATTPTASPTLTLPSIRSSPLRPRSFNPSQTPPALGLDGEEPLSPHGSPLSPASPISPSTRSPSPILSARTRSTSDPATSQDEAQLPTTPRKLSPPGSPKALTPQKSPLGRLEPIAVPVRPPNLELTRSLDNAGRPSPQTTPTDANREPFLNKIARLFGNKEA